MVEKKGERGRVIKCNTSLKNIIYIIFSHFCFKEFHSLDCKQTICISIFEEI